MSSSSSSPSSEDMSEYFDLDSPDDLSSEDSELSEGHFEGEEGTVVRDYCLSKMLGHGSYGVVWSAVKTSNDTQVALKIGRLEDVSDRETRMLTLVGSHENVIRLFDHFIWDARVVMVMDKMDMDLFTLQHDHGDEFDKKDVCRQMCCGLQHLHAAGVVHGDLKPENIMVREVAGRWLVKLADFGAASTIDGDICDYGQTVAYRSPEMVVGDTNAMRPPADVWSCACIIFEIFCDNVLFDPTSSNHYSARSTASHESSLRSNHEQLALMSEILGKFPKRFAKKHREYFNSKGCLKNLGDIKKIDMRVIMIAECDVTPQMANNLYEFLKGMLMYTPRLRSSTETCLQHRFLTTKATVPPNPVAETSSERVDNKPHRKRERNPARAEHKEHALGAESSRVQKEQQKSD